MIFQLKTADEIVAERRAAMKAAHERRMAELTNQTPQEREDAFWETVNAWVNGEVAVGRE